MQLSAGIYRHCFVRSQIRQRQFVQFFKYFVDNGVEYALEFPNI
jgi:hypothetical protein